VLKELQNPLPTGKYFVKKGFCLLSKRVQSCKELNKINLYLRSAAREGYMYAKFEEYIARLLFEIPMPSRNIPVKVKLVLPATETIMEEEVLEFTAP
jgi:hypothetical protein